MSALRSGAWRALAGAMRKPLVAIALFEGTFRFWHVPYFCDLALLHGAIHVLEHACMASAAMADRRDLRRLGLFGWRNG